MESLPIIDLADFSGAGFERRAQQISEACRTIGFFFVVNHGVPASLINETFGCSHAFFDQPVATKAELAIEKIGGNRGYSGLRHEALDPARGGDFKEAFNIGLDLNADDPEIQARKPFRTLNAWPATPGFRETLLGYFHACANLALSLHRAFALDLGLPLDFFADKFTRPMTTLRLLHYPTTPPGDIGAGEHTDYGNVTLLTTDDVGGLEVRTRSGDWIVAPPMPGALVVNIGDCLMRWTNDVYVSNPHRVVNASGRERYSIAFFFDPNPEALVEAIPSCIAEGSAAKYAPILAADYLKLRLDASKPKGM
jgi:isopenicillin N synthase-like dioxygenase